MVIEEESGFWICEQFHGIQAKMGKDGHRNRWKLAQQLQDSNQENSPVLLEKVKKGQELKESNTTKLEWNVQSGARSVVPALVYACGRREIEIARNQALSRERGKNSSFSSEFFYDKFLEVSFASGYIMWWWFLCFCWSVDLVIMQAEIFISTFDCLYLNVKIERPCGKSILFKISPTSF